MLLHIRSAPTISLIIFTINNFFYIFIIILVFTNIKNKFLKDIYYFNIFLNKIILKNKGIFKIKVDVVFQSIFFSKIHQNNIYFLFF